MVRKGIIDMIQAEAPAERRRRRTLIQPVAPQLAGALHRLDPIPSRILGTDRSATVYIPPGYDTDRTRRFDVLFMQDGQNLFDPATAFAGQHWRFGETADALIQSNEVPPIIIVGVDHAGERRIHDFTPSFDEARDAGGGADDYARFLIEELKPIVDRQFRTRAEAKLGIGGSSLGGLASLYIGLRNRDRFDRVAVMSPSIWWHRRIVLRYIRALEANNAIRIWLDIGTGEGKRAHSDARRCRDVLLAKGWTLDDDLMYAEEEGAEHHEWAWGERVGAMLKFLY